MAEIDYDWQDALAEWDRRFGEGWWYEINRYSDGTVGVTLGPVDDVDEITWAALPDFASSADVLRAGMAERERQRRTGERPN